jgi:AcrR family transcriptional regulator
MPKIVEIAEKRREILQAAAAVFTRYGYRGTNLQRVATRAGMGKSSLYHYFPTKEALFAALADEILQDEAQLFQSVVASSADAPQRLHALLDGLTSVFAEWAKSGPLLLDFLREPRGRRRVRQTFRTARAALTRLITDGQHAGLFRPGSPQALATIVLACLDGLFLQEMIEPGSTKSATRAAALPEAVMAILRREEG